MADEPALFREHESDAHEGNGALPKPSCFIDSSPRGDTTPSGTALLPPLSGRPLSSAPLRVLSVPSDDGAAAGVCYEVSYRWRNGSACDAGTAAVAPPI